LLLSTTSQKVHKVEETLVEDLEVVDKDLEDKVVLLVVLEEEVHKVDLALEEEIHKVEEVQVDLALEEEVETDKALEEEIHKVEEVLVDQVSEEEVHKVDQDREVLVNVVDHLLEVQVQEVDLVLEDLKVDLEKVQDLEEVGDEAHLESKTSFLFIF
jgi:leucyl aminopeptidase